MQHKSDARPRSAFEQGAIPIVVFAKKVSGLSIPAGVVRRDGRARHSGRRTPGSEPVGDATMRYMILVKATKDSEAGVMPPEELFAAMADYHEQLAKAGVLLDAQRAAAELEGLAHQIFRRQAHRDRRALHRDEGTRRRLHDHSSEVQARRRSNGRGAFPIPPRRRRLRDRGSPNVRARRFRRERND